MPLVFLSHSSKDKPLARRIARDLNARDVDVWLDEWEIRVSDSVAHCIQKGIAEADFVAVLLTVTAVQSGWVEKEWQAKIGVEATYRRVAILPLKADDCDIPTLLRDKKYADFSQDYDSAFRELVTAITYHEARAGTTKQDPINQESAPRVLPANSTADVLFLDDDAEQLRVVAKYIRDLGFSVAVASETRAAEELARRYLPSVIFLDAYWVNSGLYTSALLGKLRSAAPETRIIGLTSMAARNDKIEREFDSVLVMPLSTDAFLRALSSNDH
jgi:CheY-like chemotaxis protein